MLPRSRFPAALVLLALVAVLVGNVILSFQHPENRIDRAVVASILFLGGVVAFWQFLSAQSSLSASMARLSGLRSTWDTLDAGETWTDQAVRSLREHTPVDRLPSVVEVVSPVRAQAERDVTVLRWFSTGAVLVGLGGTLWGLSGAVRSAVDLLGSGASSGAAATLAEMATTLEPLTFSFWASLFAIGLSLTLTLARLSHEADLDAHFAELERALSARLTTHLFPEWSSDGARLEATVAYLAAATARIEAIVPLVSEAIATAVRRSMDEVREELREVPAALANATRAGMETAGTGVLWRLSEQERARAEQAQAVATSLTENVTRLDALARATYAEHTRLEQSANAFGAVHAAIAGQTSALLVAFERTAQETMQAHHRASATQWEREREELLEAHRAAATRQQTELLATTSHLIEQVNGAAGVLTASATAQKEAIVAVTASSRSMNAQVAETSAAMLRVARETAETMHAASREEQERLEKGAATLASLHELIAGQSAALLTSFQRTAEETMLAQRRSAAAEWEEVRRSLATTQRTEAEAHQAASTAMLRGAKEAKDAMSAARDGALAVATQLRNAEVALKAQGASAAKDVAALTTVLTRNTQMLGELMTLQRQLAAERTVPRSPPEGTSIEASAVSVAGPRAPVGATESQP